MAGKSLIGPTGTVELGPYGSVAVAGLTPEQARVLIERYVARYVRRPRVGVRIAGTLAMGDESARPTLRAQAAEEAEAPAADTPSQAVPGSWRPLQPTGKGASEPLVTGPWRPLERGSEPNAQPVTRSPARPAAPAPGVITRATAQSDSGPELLVRPQSTAKGSEPAKAEEAPAPKPVPAPNAPPVLVSPPTHGGHGGPVPRECTKAALPPYIIEPPDILLIESTQKIPDQPIRGQHLVRPDGTVGLGIYGSAFVAGMTIEQARDSVGQVLSQRIKDFDIRNLNVDVLAYNSKFYYVIADGGGYGQQVFRLPITGSETVLDAIALVNGLPPVASKKAIWLARRDCHDGSPQVLPVDWKGITQGGETATNYQVLPGDRIFVQSDPWVRFDTGVAKRISPFERLFGFTLLGSETVNSIRGRGLGGSSTP